MYFVISSPAPRSLKSPVSTGFFNECIVDRDENSRQHRKQFDKFAFKELRFFSIPTSTHINANNPILCGIHPLKIDLALPCARDVRDYFLVGHRSKIKVFLSSAKTYLAHPCARDSPNNLFTSPIFSQIPYNLNEAVEAMLVVLRCGGLGGGGKNLDAKTRRNSTGLEDMF
jgi:hypothetical protein